MRITEAAKFLGVTSQTLRNWDKSGKLKPYRHPMSNYRLYKLSELIEVFELIHREGKSDLPLL